MGSKKTRNAGKKSQKTYINRESAWSKIKDKYGKTRFVQWFAMVNAYVDRK